VSLEEERRRRIESWRHGVDVCAFIGAKELSPFSKRPANCIMITQFPIENCSEQGQFA
jgi:hypothetical protein